MTIPSRTVHQEAVALIHTKHYEESLAIERVLGNQPGIATVLNNLGLIALDQGDYGA